MAAILTTIHILAAVTMILAVLLQSGESADLAGAFGGGGSQTAFGPRGAATVLAKVTTVTAVLFMLTSFALAIIASKRSTNSVLQGATPVQQSMPLAPPPTNQTPTPGAPQSQTAPVGATSPAAMPTPTVTVKTEKTPQGAKGAAAPAKSKEAPAKPKNAPEKK